MSDLIAIREAARRLGVSDTAVRKAINAGRVRVAGKSEAGWPLLDWDETQRLWLANSDGSKRSHVGSRGAARRAEDPPPLVKLVTSDRMDEAPVVTAPPAPRPVARPAPPPPADDPPEDMPAGPASGRGPGYAQARAVRETFNAKLAKLEFEQRSGKLVDVDQVKIEAFKVHRRVRDSLLNIPDRCAPQLATMGDPAEVHAFLLGEITQALRMLSADIYGPTGG